VKTVTRREIATWHLADDYSPHGQAFCGANVGARHDWGWASVLEQVNCLQCLSARIRSLESIADYWITKHFDDTMAAKKSGYEDAQAEFAELRKNKERLDWLESKGFATTRNSKGDGPEDDPGVHSWNDYKTGERGWTAAWISSEFKSAREAIDAAMEPK